MDRRVFLIALAFFIAMPSLAEARKWTDLAGNQISADYVRVHEGEVILRQGTHIIRCPYDKFSDLDKAYIREQMEAEQDKSKRRTGIRQIGGPVAPENGEDDDARELRTWHDTQGRKILAQYTGFTGGLVELIKDGKRVAYPYSAFSAVDQSYIAQILISEGRLDEIPKENEGSTEETDAQVAGNEGNPRRGSSFGNRTGESGAMPGDFPSHGPDHGIESPPSFSPPPTSSPNFEPPNASLAPSHINHGSHEFNHKRGSDLVGAPDNSTPGSNAPGMMGTVAVCSNCDKEVPAHIGAGDRCPHCNIRFDYEEKPDGSRQYAGDFTRFQRRVIVRLAVLGFFVVFGALSVLFRR